MALGIAVLRRRVPDDKKPLRYWRIQEAISEANRKGQHHRERALLRQQRTVLEEALDD